MAYTLDNWLSEALEFYRDLDFFKHLRGEKTAVVKALRKSLEDTSTEPITLDDLMEPEFDLFFLSLDPFRSLYSVMDFGDYLAPGNEAYVSSLEALSKISRGVFRPENPREHWDGPEGPIRVSFLLRDEEQQLRVETWGGAFDFRILLQMNALLKASPYRFEMAPMDDILFVTVLTAKEKHLMERERGLSFMVLDLPRLFHPVHELAEPIALPENGESIFYVGTLNEHLDRCVGRLRFILTDNDLEGFHRYIGSSHSEDFTFKGTLNREDMTASGTLHGHIDVSGERIAYEGSWSGQWHKGNRVATGTWEGWFVRDKDPGEEKPAEDSQIYRGEWALLEEGFSQSHHQYISRLRAWLESVWEARSTEDYPWLLTIE